MRRPPQRILIAPDSFKECLSSPEVARCLAAGFQEVLPDSEIITLPLADGGEGTLEVLLSVNQGRLLEKEVTGPLSDYHKAAFVVLSDGRTAVIEMARASGLELVPRDRRDSPAATSAGTGQLMHEALDRGCSRILLAVGGSATTDAGTGALAALGFMFRDKNGHTLKPGGAGLLDLHSIDSSGAHPALKTCEIRIACDVDNPLFGPQGAAFVYAPQKGATAQEVEILDQGLRRFAAVCEQYLNHKLDFPPGSGAAGGIAGGFWALCGARLQRGFDMIAEQVDLCAKLEDVDLVVTGEGAINSQTASGKVPGEVARLAKARGIPVIAVAGMLGQGHEELYSLGIESMHSLCSDTITSQQSIAQAPALLKACASRIARTLTGLT